MSTGRLIIDLDSITANWRALDGMSDCRTAAVVKADGYGLGADTVATALSKAGVTEFFVAVAQEGARLRQTLGSVPRINVFSGHMQGDTALIRDYALTPMLNSLDQFTRHLEILPDHPFGIQLDTGMNRLGMEAADWENLRAPALAQNPTLVMSHLACADTPDHPMNRDQLHQFRKMTDGINVPRSLSATGGILLGPDYHFDLTRPGIGLYGGLPFAAATPVVTLDLPVVQVRDVNKGETVGYGNTWQARHASRIATVSSGYADGIARVLSDQAMLYHGKTPCPLVGRVSMDLLTVDVTALDIIPDMLTLIGPQQRIDDLAKAAGTIGYEILTQLGARYIRSINGA